MGLILGATFLASPGGWILAYQRLNQGLSKNSPALLIPPYPVLISSAYPEGPKIALLGVQMVCVGGFEAFVPWPQCHKTRGQKNKGALFVQNCINIRN